MPSSLGGFSEGLWADIDRQREEQRRLEDERSRNERSVLTTLLQSKDPKIQTYALAGMLDSAQPKRKMKGIHGLLGEMEANPAIQQIHDYLTTPQTTTVPGLPSTNLIPTGPTSPGPARPDASPEGGFTNQGPLPQAPKQGAAAMPTTSPVTGGKMVGAPPPIPSSSGMVPMQAPTTAPPPVPTASMAPPTPSSASAAVTPPPQPGVIRQEHKGPAVGRTDVTYPQAFYTPEEAIRHAGIAREQAEVEGAVAGYVALGMPREQAVAQVMAERQRAHGSGAGGYQAIQGTLPGSTQPVWGVFDRTRGQFVDPQTHEPLPGFNARVTSASSSMGSSNEAMARAMFGQPYSTLQQDQQMDVLAAVRADAAAKAGATTTARTEAQASGPLTKEQSFQATTKLQKEWQDVSKVSRLLQSSLSTMQAGIEAVDRGDANAGGQAVLVTYQKMLDPISVVRESEYLRSAVGEPLLQRFQGAYERLFETGGAGIPKEELQQFIRTAQDISDRAQAALEPERQRITETATTFGLNPALVIPGSKPAAAKPTPGAANAPAATTPTDQSKLTGTPVTMDQVLRYVTYKQQHGYPDYTKDDAIAQFNRDQHPVVGQ